MPISLGLQFDHYEILAPLGKGGMGEVYRAKDTRLNREVAIKVLPSEVAHDAERLRRFEVEAKAVGTLNHPNILTVYDFGNYEGNPYLVMELLEGEELRVQLDNNVLPVRKAVDYAQQIATGLSAAHAKNIVHRDLKPANIFVTTDGRVKILDFGLAKLMQKWRKGEGEKGRLGEDDSTLSLSPLLPFSPSPITAPGIVMGTVGYMSPEQVQGQVADHRSDIFSFGVILYEMLSGKRAFTGSSMIETMHAILKNEPPELSETNAKISPALDRIVRRCLEKKPERRFQSASDLSFALEALTLPSSSGANRTEAGVALNTAATRNRWRDRSGWLVAAGLLLTTLGLTWAYFTRQPEAESRVFKTSLLPPDKSSFESFAVSPDGKWLAFTAATGAKVQLWVRALDAMEARALPGTEGAFYPFWSPDSRFIGFFVPGKLKKVEASGGPVQTVCDLRRGTGGAWNRDGVILFGESVQSLSQVSATGGPVTTATTLDPARQESVHYGPSFLPDGRHFLYYIRSTQKDVRGIYLGSLDGKVKQRLLGDDSNVVYVAARAADRETGYLLFQRAGALLAQPFDARQRQLTGEPFPVAEAVARSMPFTSGYFSASDNGVLIFDPNGNKRNSQLLWVDRSGKQMGSVGTASSRPWLSPDEKRFVADRRDPQTALSSLWMANVSGANATPFTFGQTNDQQPIWSPDGNRIVWASSHTGVLDIYQKAASGDGQDELLYRSDEFKIPCDWSRDGRFLAYISRTPKTRSDLWVISVGSQSGNSQPYPFLQTEADEGGGRFSPNGEWLAYVSDESGRHEVYVERFPAHGGKRQLSTAGGVGPIWRRDGKELFYQAADGKVMAVAVEPGAEFKASTPVALFEFRSGNTANLVTNPSYTVTGDGQRFLVNALVETKESAPLTVVTNWTVGAKK